MNHLYLNNTHAPENIGIKNDQFLKFTLIIVSYKWGIRSIPCPNKTSTIITLSNIKLL